MARAQAEPVAFQGMVQATLALLVGFGLISWTGEQTGLALALSAAILTLLARRHVTPNAKITGPAPEESTSVGSSADATPRA